MTLLASGFFWLAAAPPAALAQAGFEVPRFRMVDPAAPAPGLPRTGEIRLLADSDFPPFSFGAADGRAAGLAVDLAQAACAELRLSCRVILRPFGELLPALSRAEGDAVIAGPRLAPQALAAGDPTRPFYRAIGRFAARRESGIERSDAASLAKRRIGAATGTSHAAWLERYYAGSTLIRFADEAAAREALKAGEIDVLFGDGLRLAYWVEGEASSACCRLIDSGYNAPDYFSQAMVFLVRREAGMLRQALDFGLDRLQASGAFAEIFRRYVPLSPW